MLLRLTVLLCACFLFHPSLTFAKNVKAERFQVESFSLTPTLFSPNGDGVFDEAVAQVVFLCRSTGISAPGHLKDKKGISRLWKVQWTIQVFPEGAETLISSFSGSHPLNPTTDTTWRNGVRTTATIPWNGLDAESQSLPSGRYSLTLHASFIRETTVRLRADKPDPKVQTLSIGTVQLSLGIIEIDVTIPSLTLTLPTENSYVQESATAVAGTCFDDNLDTVTVNGIEVTLLDGSFSRTVVLAEGNNLTVVKALDKAGNSSLIERSIIRDSIPPVLTLAQLPLWTSDTEIVVMGTLQEPNLSFLKINNQIINVENGSFSHVIPLPEEGPNTITCIAEDLAGNTTQVDLVVNRDSIVPSLTIAPAEGTALTTNLPTLTATFSDSGAGIAPASFSVLLDAVDVTAKFIQSAIGASWQLAPTDALAEGEHVLTIQIADNAGNTASETVTFIAPASTQDPGWDDSSPPLVLNMYLSQRFFCPAENPYAPPDKRKVVATFSLSEPSLVSLNIYKPNGDVLKSVNLGRLDVGEHTTEWNGCAPDGRYMVDGVYQLGLSLQDLHGNAGTETRATVVLYY